ncbi:cytochrome c oxidase subunit III (mitochondrion) [Panonychus citri]|uniref:Cytochrome c oxidase subunit 3 n=1 Tax=Panonychus citri TaxID=50023 RepID=D9J2S3_PANCT|nr:cytochrome c oxidase subunit III [Panonychus citri]ADJ66661.1 cytochrome c oxidase subunit III [Panonychus citri]
MLNMNYFFINLSPSPIMYTIMLFFFLNCLNNFFWKIQNYLMVLILIFSFFFFLFYKNFSMMSNENNLMGFFTWKKKKIISNGFIMFIISEMMVFISLFWSYIHNAFSPNIFMGNFWPPKGIIPSNPTSMIIFGTSILLSSSFIIMISHNYMIEKNYKFKTLLNFLFCLIMGLMFIDMQILEMSNFYMKLNFNFNDSIFSSSFILTTSLHASHVILGLMALFHSFILLLNNNMNIYNYLSFEFSIWYWHFVDYIWIVVFSLFY